MGRQVNEAKITTRAARAKLPLSKMVHWRAIDRGYHLGYRKGMNGGTWIARYRKPDGTYVTGAVGAADDALPADGVYILDFSQALKTAQAWCRSQSPHGETQNARQQPYTVADAVTAYLAWFQVHRRSVAQTKQAIEAHILPMLGNIEVSRLTASQLRQWHEQLALTPARLRPKQGEAKKYRAAPASLQEQRQRRSTANRILTILKAALNYAFEHGKVESDEAWRRVKAFRNVDAATVRYLSTEEISHLLAVCSPDFRDLVQGALLTGCRYGELVTMRCADFDSANGSVLVRESKNGKARHVMLADEGATFFAKAIAGKSGSDLIFVRADGTPWGRSYQQRPIVAACKAAGIKPAISFHVLRHTHASHLAMNGVPMAVIAHQLGHGDTRMAEKHYAHLAPSYVANEIRRAMISFGKLPTADIRYPRDQTDDAPRTSLS